MTRVGSHRLQPWLPTHRLSKDMDAAQYDFAAPFIAPQGSPIRELFKYLGRPGMISFAGGYPSQDLFDRQGIGRALQQAYEADPVACLQYGDTRGAPGLRSSLARLMGERGVRCDADNVVVTTGSQQGFDLLIRMMIQPGDTAIVEEPAYPAAIQALRLAGANLLTVPVDAQGIDVERLEALLQTLPEGRRAKLLYTVPTFANPTGATLSAERRVALLRLAVAHRLLIVEDDPYGELRFGGEAMPSLLELAKTVEGAPDWVAYLGSLSKIIAPGLRIGWLIAPDAIQRRAVVAKQVSDLCTAPFLQEVACHYLDSGALARHLGAICGAYRLRCEALVNALQQFLPDELSYTVPQGGMFVWAALAQRKDATVLLRRAIEHNVMYVPGAAFYVRDADPSTMRLSFAAPGEAEVFEGIKRLKLALAR